MTTPEESSAEFSGSQLQQIDSIRERFRQAWLAGARPDLDALLAEASPGVRGHLFKELLRLDVQHRRQHGDDPSLAEYLSRFPADEAVTRGVFDELTRDPAGPSSEGGSSGPTEEFSALTVRRPGSEPPAPGAEVAELLERLGIAHQIHLQDPPSDRQPPEPQQPVEQRPAEQRRGASDEPGPDQAGRYRLTGVVGRGGFGTVYQGQDSVLGRTLAVKLLTRWQVRTEADEGGDLDRHAQHVARFVEEAQVTAQLEHPGIVPVHELSVDSDGQLFFSMRLIKGRELEEVFKLVRRGQADWNLPRAVGVMVKVCHAVAYAHSRGVIHRDLKPSNIIVGRFGAVYVMDWGLAKVVGHEDLCDLRLDIDASQATVHSDRRLGDDDTDSPLVTMDGTVVGTPAYMSPEQAEGRVAEIDHSSDVYSLGAILYRLLTGQAPYVKPGARISPYTIVGMVSTGAPQPVHELNRDAPPQLVAICEKAMARDKHRRYASSLELAEDLQAFLDNRVVRAFRTGAVAELRSWVRRNRGTALASAAAVLFLILGLATVAALELRASRRVQRAYGELSAAQKGLRAQTQAQRESLYALTVLRIAALRDEGYPVEVEQMLEDCPEELRGWEWRRLRHVFNMRASDRVVTTEDTDSSAVLSDDGSNIVSFSKNGVSVIDLESGDKVRTFPEGAESLEVRPGRGQFTATLDNVLSLRSLDEGEHIWRETHDAPFTALAISPSGDRIATGDQRGRVQLWDAEKGTLLHSSGDQAAVGGVSSLAFSPQADRLAAAGHFESAGTVVVWNVETDDIARRSLNFPPRPIRSRPDVESGDDPQYMALAWGPFGLRIAAGGSDGQLHVWSAEGGSPIHTFHHPAPLQAVALSSDASLVAASDNVGVTKIWDAWRGEFVKVLSGHEWVTSSLRFDASGTRLLSANFDKTARIWSLAADALTLRGHQVEVWSAAFDPLRPRLVTGGFGDGTLKWWDLNTGEEIRSVFAHYGGVIWWVTFSPDGSSLASAGQDGTIRIWDAESGRELCEMQALEPPEGDDICLFADFSPDGKTLVSGGFDRKLRYWNPQTGELLRESEPVTDDRIWSVEYSPDGQRIVVGASDSTRVLSADDDRELARIDTGAIYARASLSPDGTCVLTGNTHVELWDATTGKRIRELSAKRAAAVGLGFSPDGKRALASGADGTIRIWDPAAGNLLLTLQHGRGRIAYAGFSPDGERIISCAADGTVKVWETGSSRPQSQQRRTVELARGAVDAAAAAAADPYSLEQVLGRLNEIEHLDDAVRSAAARLARVSIGSPSFQLMLCQRRWRDARTRGAGEATFQHLLAQTQALLEQDGENPLLHLWLAVQQSSLGDLEAARQSADRAAELYEQDPDRPTSAFRRYARLYNQLGEPPP